MDSDARHAQLIAKLCAFASMLMLLVLVASAVIRIIHHGCADVAYPDMLTIIARLIHRIAALVVGVLLIIIAFFVLRCRPVVGSRIAVLGGLSVLTVFLSVLGPFTSGSDAPAVVIGNVVAGMALSALFWRMRLEFLPRESYQRPDRQLSSLATSARSLTGLQIWLGSWVAGLEAAVDCRTAQLGNKLVLWPDSPAWSALNPFHAPTVTAEAAAQALGWLSSLHEFSAALVLMVVAMLCISLQRSSGGLHRAAPGLMLLLGVQVALGITSVFAGHSLWVGVLHNAVAALLLLNLLGIHFRLHRS